MSVDTISLNSTLTKECLFSGPLTRERPFAAPLTAYMQWKSEMAKTLKLESTISLEED